MTYVIFKKKSILLPFPARKNAANLSLDKANIWRNAVRLPFIFMSVNLVSKASHSFLKTFELSDGAASY